jgi:hypothetical protein
VGYEWGMGNGEWGMGNGERWKGAPRLRYKDCLLRMQDVQNALVHGQ